MEGDASEDTTDDDYNKWKKPIWDKLNQQFCLEEKSLKELRESESGFEVIISNEKQEIDFDSYVFEEDKIESRLREYFHATNATMSKIRELRQKPSESSCLHVEFLTSESGRKDIQYETAGNIAIYPENDDQTVEEFAKEQGYTLSDIFSLASIGSRAIKLPIPSPMKVSTFLTRFCDLLGPVNKMLVQSLSLLSKDVELATLTEKWMKDSEAFELEVQTANHSLLSLSRKYKISIPFGTLISISNRIFPRFYTIASSPRMHPESIQICISISSHNTPLGERKGLSSAFFTSLKNKYSQQQQEKLQTQQMSKRIRIFQVKSLFQFPEVTHPMIMIGPGAGLAPFRAFLQEKKARKMSKHPIQIGECFLYFGCRASNVDFIYDSDLKEFEKDGTCEHLRIAFSRKTSKKVYVQDLMNEDINTFADLILNKQAVIYVCGSKSVGESIKDFLTNLLKENLQLQSYEAYCKVSELESEKKLIMELWG